MKRTFYQRLFRGFLWFFQRWDHILCVGRVSQKEVSVYGSSFSAAVTDRPATENRYPGCMSSEPVKDYCQQRKEGRTEPKACYMLSYQPKEQRARHPPSPACWYDSHLFQNRIICARIVQHTRMRLGRRNRFGVQFRLEMHFTGLVSFTSASAVIALGASKSHWEDWRKFWFCLKLQGLIALQNIMHCTNTQE